MSFIARVNLPHAPVPTRAYFHDSGYLEAFGDQATGRPDILHGTMHLLEILKHERAQSEYLIAALYGDNGYKMVELFGYGDRKGWPGNPTKYRWTFADGMYLPDRIEDGCEDSDIILSTEALWRRRNPNTGVFMLMPPSIPSIFHVFEGYDFDLSETVSGTTLITGRFNP